mmetsp:Transcript_13147/g.21605  ORF Transcript_13147/g.21605 Transcript_13147/m.21605 type:complete len:98 (+) Transcript_13147:90-383(+)
MDDGWATKKKTIGSGNSFELVQLHMKADLRSFSIPALKSLLATTEKNIKSLVVPSFCNTSASNKTTSIRRYQQLGNSDLSKTTEIENVKNELTQGTS